MVDITRVCDDSAGNRDSEPGTRVVAAGEPAHMTRTRVAIHLVSISFGTLNVLFIV
jgi:hypothetical protein